MPTCAQRDLGARPLLTCVCALKPRLGGPEFPEALGLRSAGSAQQPRPESTRANSSVLSWIPQSPLSGSVLTPVRTTLAQKAAVRGPMLEGALQLPRPWGRVRGEASLPLRALPPAQLRLETVYSKRLLFTEDTAQQQGFGEALRLCSSLQFALCRAGFSLLHPCS